MNSGIASVISLVVVLSSSLMLVGPATATELSLNLPSTEVNISVSNGTVSYFDILLSDVPSGYDIVNGTYVGWCVDRRRDMVRSPTIHNVTLYSSYDPPSLLMSERWDVLNYILNHKQGTGEDVQQAIWYFINLVGNYTASSPTALSIISDAIANGAGFVPKVGEVEAVICYTTETDAQISVIEVTIPLSDTEPPVSMLIIGEPNSTQDGNRFVSAQTPFWINVTDGGSGVAGTWLRINYTHSGLNIALTLLDWARYPDSHPPFYLARLTNLPGSADCNYTIEFYSRDLVGNTETVQIAFVTLVGPDIDDSGLIDFHDLSIVIASYNSFLGKPRWNVLGDLNFDQRVDLRDIVAVLRNFGRRPQHVFVTPEVFFG